MSVVKSGGIAGEGGQVALGQGEKLPGLKGQVGDGGLDAVGVVVWGEGGELWKAAPGGRADQAEATR